MDEWFCVGQSDTCFIGPYFCFKIALGIIKIRWYDCILGYNEGGKAGRMFLSGTELINGGI